MVVKVHVTVRVKFAVYVYVPNVLIKIVLKVPIFAAVAPLIRTCIPEIEKKVCAGLKVGIIPQLCV